MLKHYSSPSVGSPAFFPAHRRLPVTISIGKHIMMSAAKQEMSIFAAVTTHSTKVT